MILLITAGPVSERIDAVRRITNAATGRLGALTAEAFDRQAGDRIEKIIYVCETRSVKPDVHNLEIVITEGAENLERTMKELLVREKPDAVIHSMAVSDYTVDYVTSITGYARPEEKRLDNSGKISSDIEHPILHLKKTPKVIRCIKETSPDTILVGFKLLDGAATEELVYTAGALLTKNNCAFVVANDAQSIHGNDHTAYLVFPERSYKKVEGKKAIAEAIARETLLRIDRKGKLQ